MYGAMAKVRRLLPLMLSVIVSVAVLGCLPASAFPLDRPTFLTRYSYDVPPLSNFVPTTRVSLVREALASTRERTVVSGGKPGAKSTCCHDLSSARTTSSEFVAAKPLCSFGVRPRVLMADGSTKPVSDVEVGDLVLAQDPETGEIGARKNTGAWVHDVDLVRLEIDGDIVTTLI